MAEDRIDKLIEIVSKQNELLPGQHASDAMQLKKEWFNYVLLSLEKANSAIDKLENDQHLSTKELLQGLMQAKEDLRAEMTTLRSAYDLNLDRLEKRIEKALDVLNRKVESISIPAVKQELKHEITKLKTELLQGISKTKEELRVNDLDPIKKNVTTLKVKVAMFGVFGGLIGSGIVALVVALVKHALGGPTP